MLFNSIEFAIFLPIVFLLYWLVLYKNIKTQNGFLVLVSYLFYGWWDWRFLSLIIFSSCIDFVVGLLLSKTHEQKKRKALLLTSILINLGFLGFFKYFNFFAESFADAFTLLGSPIELNRLNIILPVGISFYTFQTLSYSIDVYKRKLRPTKDILSFFAFVSFFPQLVAGPIERASHLLPQFFNKREFIYENALKGLTQICWGLFKKIVVADSCAFIVDQIFQDYNSYSGSTLLLGAILFAFQIYGDFSGYSDMAIGTARLFGFTLKENFAMPYFSRDIAEFWRRWHISLTSWFRDYLYIPLGGNRGRNRTKIRNVFIIFVVCGFWHGANWTFIIWGFYNACLFIPLLLTQSNRKHINGLAHGRSLPTVQEFFQMTITFVLVVLGWIIFRSENIFIAYSFYAKIFSKSLLTLPYVFGIGKERFLLCLLFILLMICLEWIKRGEPIPFYFEKEKCWVKWSLIFLMAVILFLFGEKQQAFIYFQF